VAFFQGIIGVPPTQAALISLRELFSVTGPVTREQKRKRNLMVLAFEMHRPTIFFAMQDPIVLRTVISILVNGNNRIGDREVMEFHACKFFVGLQQLAR
jgi:hypothetical protein